MALLRHGSERARPQLALVHIDDEEQEARDAQQPQEATAEGQPVYHGASSAPGQTRGILQGKTQYWYHGYIYIIYIIIIILYAFGTYRCVQCCSISIFFFI